MIKTCIPALLCLAMLPAAGQEKGPIASAVKTQYEGVKRNFVEAAQVMPEENYGFRLTPPQRPYGEWIEHTAGMNNRMCSTVKGETAPKTELGDKSKAALVAALEASFKYCDSVLDGMNDAAMVKPMGEAPRQTTALAVFLSQIANLNSHYGNMVGYLRVKGVTPPSTARAQKK